MSVALVSGGVIPYTETMKKLVWIPMVSIALVLSGCRNKKVERIDPSFPVSIVVASDLHYLSPSLTDHGEFFEDFITYADGKVMEYSEELLEAFTEQVITEKPAYVVLTGDLTYNGEKQSHEDLVKKLKRIEAAGIQVCVIPGNHDLDTYTAKYIGDGYEIVDSVTKEEFEQLYEPYGYGEAISKDEHSLSYVTQVNPQLRLLFVDVNTEAIPGYCTPDTMAWMEEVLKQAKQEDCRVISFSHQSMIQQSAVSTGFVIDNARDLQRLMEQEGVQINFSGHLHIQHTKTVDNCFSEVITSALAVNPCQYGLLEVDERGLRYETEQTNVEQWAKTHSRTDENLLHFSQYAKDFFVGSGIQKATAAFSDLENSREIAEYFAGMNTLYFSGHMDEMQWNPELDRAIGQSESSFSQYIRSLKNQSENFNRFEITWNN